MLNKSEYYYISNKFRNMEHKPIMTDASQAFLEKYLNNAAPTGYEWEGQKLWMDY